MNQETHPNSEARDLCFQFLYKCDVEKMYYFNPGGFKEFVEYFPTNEQVATITEKYCLGTLQNLDKIDAIIAKQASNWKIERMPTADRNILRLAVFELFYSDTPFRVVLNEAIELAKKYGAQESSGFVNGILDPMVKDKR